MTEYFEVTGNYLPPAPLEYRVVTSPLRRIKFQGLAPLFNGPPWKGKKVRYLGKVYTVTRGWSQTRHGITTYRLSVTQEQS